MASTLDVVKVALRIPSTVTLYDTELNSLIEAAAATMRDSGVNLEREDSAVIDSASIMFVKSNFGNRPDAERCKEAFDAIVRQRALIDWGASDA